MSSDESSSSNEYQECILKCKGAKQFYNLPKKVGLRKTWLFKLGIEADDFNPHPWVCDRHFSDQMFATENKLRAYAVPDKNLPNALSTVTEGIVKKTAPAKLPVKILPKTLSTVTEGIVKKTAPAKLPVKIHPKTPSTVTEGIVKKKTEANLPVKIANKAKIATKSKEKSNFGSNKTMPVSDTKAPSLAINDSNPQAIDTQNWINDSSNILVDYQLKVQGKHLCDVIEIPQFIVVFTVVKAKNAKKKIELNDLETQRKKRENLLKRIGKKKLPKPRAFITIDDDIDDTPEIFAQEAEHPAVVQGKPSAIIQSSAPTIDQPQVQAINQPLVPAINQPLVPAIDQPLVPAITQPQVPVIIQSAIIQSSAPAINQPQVPAINQPQVPAINQPLVPAITQPQVPATNQTHVAAINQPHVPAINQPQVTAIIESKSPAIIQPLPQAIIQQTTPQPSCQSKPEIDIVYYTAKDALPRRDRSVQADLFSTKETAIQCDVQLDNDITEMAYNAKLYWVKSSSRMTNPQIKMHECLVCGEIVSNYASKVRHAHGHEKTPSLCSHCGVLFENQIKLKTHVKTFHSKKSTLRKPLRCPRKNCVKAFHSEKQLIKHIEEHTQTKQHKCNKCLQFFDSSLKLICHQRALDKCLRTRGWTSRRWSKRI